MSTLIESERSDDIPLIIHWLLAMKIQDIVDGSSPEPHQNWQGLSYGQIVVVFLCYVVTQQDHRMCAVEAWVMTHQQTLMASSGWTITPSDVSDDRIAQVLSVLGHNPIACEQIEAQLGQQLIRGYDLPTKVGRVDTTSFSVYHQPSQASEANSSLLQYGHSKDHRPDLRQYRYLLGTIDPAGMPLVTGTLAGNGSDDSVYVSSWERLKRRLLKRKSLDYTND